MTLLTSRTPLRVSFFGGGTDYPEYFRHYKGAVIGTAIDKYIYTSAIRLERFMGYSWRLSYRTTEEVREIAEIEHPMFRAAFDYVKLEKGWNFSVLTALPSRSGLGSSSSFAVGLIKLLGAIKDTNYTRHDLVSLAIHLEREVLNENVGVQDQMHAAYGGFNRYEFSGNDFAIYPVRMHSEVRDLLNASMYLVHTGVQRFASEILKEQIAKTKEKRIITELDHLYQLVQAGHELLEGKDSDKTIRELGSLLHEGWMMKRSLSTAISSPEIDAIYTAARVGGALGGKLCGAGGGGFFLMIVYPEHRASVQKELGDRELIPIQIDDSGSTIIRS
jgi:D-glycero-alpha-D-manno-heptose-7-phosphate kinase